MCARAGHIGWECHVRLPPPNLTDPWKGTYWEDGYWKEWLDTSSPPAPHTMCRLCGFGTSPPAVPDSKKDNVLWCRCFPQGRKGKSKPTIPGVDSEAKCTAAKGTGYLKYTCGEFDAALQDSYKYTASVMFVRLLLEISTTLIGLTWSVSRTPSPCMSRTRP